MGKPKDCLVSADGLVILDPLAILVDFNTLEDGRWYTEQELGCWLKTTQRKPTKYIKANFTEVNNRLTEANNRLNKGEKNGA